MDPAIHFFVIGQPDFIKLPGRIRKFRRAKISAAEKYRIDFVSGNGKNPFHVFNGDFTLAVKNLSDKVRFRGNIFLPQLYVPDSFRVPEFHAGYLCGISQRSAAERCHHSFSRGKSLVDRSAPVLQLLLINQPELFQIIVSIQLLLINRPLPVDGFKSKTRRRHFSSSRKGGVAFGIHENVALFIGSNMKPHGNHHPLPPGSFPLLKRRLIVKSEYVVFTAYPNHVNTHRINKFPIHITRHLKGVNHTEGLPLQSEMSSQL